MPLPPSRAFSPPTSTTSSAQGNPPPIQIKKVVVEGRSKHDGASLKMYLKLSVTVDNISPGTSIPLFREDSIRITHSKVHPLDDRFVPYFYSSTEQPLLHKAAVALHLGTKSSRHYNSLFPVSSPPLDPSHVGASRRNRESTASEPPNDEQYTGFIVVSGYNVTLVLPREFPPRVQPATTGAESDGDDGFTRETPSSWSTRSARRASSIFHRSYLHMMAVVEMFVPYTTIPPKGPFLVSIPVPRCLDNHIKLRISTPPVTSVSSSSPRASFVSTSSEDDTPGWDFLTDPPVSRKIDKSMRKGPYQQSADDEQSDSNSGSSIPGTELIRGAYQSTDVLHVRWAPPQGKRSGMAKTEDGMRRVGVEWTVGKMKYDVLGRNAQSIKLGVTYDGVCNSLWHPSVATMLGMDFALDVKGRRVSWPEGGAAGWTVSGDRAFADLHSEAPQPSEISSRRGSLESSASTPFLPTLTTRTTTAPSRSSASLLRAPLPNHNTPDYSFESSPGVTPPPTTPPAETLSAYFPQNNSDHDSKLSNPDAPPGKSITFKINLLKLLPPAKNIFNFSVKGIVMIDAAEDDFIPLPVFRVLGSEKENIDATISLLAEDIIVQVGTGATEGPRRVLQQGEEVRCEDGFGLIVNSKLPQLTTISTPPSRAQSRTKSSHTKLESSDMSSAQSLLPCVLSTVTPLPRTEQYTHCVRVNIPAYALDADVVEFGLTIPQRAAASGITTVEVLYAIYAGRYVRAELLPRGTDALPPTLSGSTTNGEVRIVGEVQFLIVVHLEDVEAAVGEVEVVYLVGEVEKAAQGETIKGKAREEVVMDVLLPCFQQSISRYEVEIDCPAKYDPQIKYSTLNQYNARSNTLKLTSFTLPGEFFPVVSLSLLPSPELHVKHSGPRRAVSATWRTLPHLVALVLLYLIVSIGSEVRQVRETMNVAARAFISGVPYSDPYWGDDVDPAGRLWRYPEEQGFTPEYSKATPPTSVATTAEASSATTSMTREKTTVSSSTPTIDLAEATLVREKQPSPPQRGGDGRRLALIPLPALPLLSWQPLSLETKEIILKGLRRVLHILRRIIDFPLDPD